jgi:hypothetical protein
MSKNLNMHADRIKVKSLLLVKCVTPVQFGLAVRHTILFLSYCHSSLQHI